MHRKNRARRIATRAIMAIALVVLIPPGSSDSIAADEPGPLTIVPVRFDAGTIHAGSKTDLEFVISNTSEEAIRLIYIHAECDCSLTLPDCGTVPAAGKFVLRAKLTTGKTESGQLAEQITILTDHPVQNELKIPVSAWITEARQSDDLDISGG